LVSLYLRGWFMFHLLVPVITSDFGKTTLVISAQNPGFHEITVWTYDQFLNRAVDKGEFEVK
jgi:hypothetical protein